MATAVANKHMKGAMDGRRDADTSKTKKTCMNNNNDGRRGARGEQIGMTEGMDVRRGAGETMKGVWMVFAVRAENKNR